MRPESKERILNAIKSIYELLVPKWLKLDNDNIKLPKLKIVLGNGLVYSESFDILSGSNIGTILTFCQKMEKGLKDEYYSILPETVPYTTEEIAKVLTLRIVSDFESLNRLLLENNFESAFRHLEYIKYYLLITGLWNKSDDNQVEDQLELTKKINLDLENLKSRIEENLEKQEFAINKLNIAEDLAKKFVSETKVIFDSMESDLKKLEQVEGVLSNAKGTQQLIVSIKDQVQEILNNAQNEVNLKTKEFEILTSDISKSIYQTRLFEQKLSEINGSVNTYADDFKIQYEEILSKKDYIARLERLAADDTLGTRFDKRKGEIRYSVWIWFISSIAVFFVSLWWSNTVFTSTVNSKIITGKGLEFSYFDYFFIFFRTAPAYIVLYFCFSRYIKERNFQEEYAFKSVISMTLTAYSDMLANTDEEKQKAKIEMLQKSIASIYTQPRVHTESNRPFFSFNSKDVSESLKQLVEAIKTVKP